MTTRTIWGTINANGTILSGSGDFAVSRTGNGQYQIQFNDDFSATPAIVGSQVLGGSLSQNPLDNLVFPFLNKNGATALTGDAHGNQGDRNFSFIVIGV
ncbi:hypothetical protein [Agrobacterium vitis]|uniref:hypothetical protein n=1 Tax=Agrobacterium vitis TaxID=373 RepID=UPI001573D5A2|nr:hypothetical protein [Agrobacterium vitis]NSZ17882.1 hypothetical protein [Agrobacterium vitis]QZO03552.1 hypothetical protein K4831_14135 [Agrobacterium vitis]UJL88675.1 hypothetical protein AVF2S5_12480 [Agrobacterium vitis]